MQPQLPLRNATNRPLPPSKAAPKHFPPAALPARTLSPAPAASSLPPAAISLASGEADMRVCVAVRMRPLNENEAANSVEAWRLQGENAIVQIMQTEENRAAKDEAWVFDCVYGPGATNSDVYQGIADGVVSAAMSGVNGTIFAYGQTASGKTHTMQGTESDPGIIRQAARSLFEERQGEHSFSMTYVEVYNERVKDLLSQATGSQAAAADDLKVREDRENGFFCEGVTSVTANSYEEFMDAFHKGESRRHVAGTDMNAHSSRSHTILQVTVATRDPLLGTVRGRLSLVDLAGSENVRSTHAEGERLKEGGKINTSLLTLSRVIQSLAAKKAGQHVNFRDSKLTMLLQSSLAGNCRTAVVCCATPSSIFAAETLSTLKFANSAKRIRTQVATNHVAEGARTLQSYKDQEILLQRALAERSEAVNRLQEQLRARDFEAQSEALSRCQEEANELRAELDSVQRELDLLRSEREELKQASERARALQVQLDEAEARQARALGDLDRSHRLELSVVQGEREEALKRIQVESARANAWEAKARAGDEALQAEAAQSQAALADAQTREAGLVKAKEVEALEWAARVASGQKELESARESLRLLDSAHQSATLALKAQLDAALAQTATLEAMMAEMKREALMAVEQRDEYSRQLQEAQHLLESERMRWEEQLSTSQRQHAKDVQRLQDQAASELAASEQSARELLAAERAKFEANAASTQLLLSEELARVQAQAQADLAASKETACMALASERAKWETDLLTVQREHAKQLQSVQDAAQAKLSAAEEAARENLASEHKQMQLRLDLASKDLADAHRALEEETARVHGDAAAAVTEAENQRKALAQELAAVRGEADEQLRVFKACEAQLKTDLEAAQTQLTEAHRAIEVRTRALNMAEEAIAEGRTKEEALLQDAQRIAAQGEEALRTQRQEAQVRESELQRQLVEVTRAALAHAERGDDLQTRLDTATAQLHMHAQEAGDIGKALLAAQQQIGELEAKLKAAQGDKESMARALDTHVNELSIMREQAAQSTEECDQRLGQANAALSDANEQLASVRRAVSDMQAQCAALQEQLLERTSALERLETTNAETTVLLGQAQRRTAEVEAQLEDSRRDADWAQNEASETKRALEAAQAKLRGAIVDGDALIAQSEAERARLAKELDDCQAIARESQAEWTRCEAKLLAKIEELQGGSDRANADLSTATQTLATLEASLTATKTDLEATSKAKAASERELETMSQEQERMRERIAKLERVKLTEREKERINELKQKYTELKLRESQRDPPSADSLYEINKRLKRAEDARLAAERLAEEAAKQADQRIAEMEAKHKEYTKFLEAENLEYIMELRRLGKVFE